MPSSKRQSWRFAEGKSHGSVRHHRDLGGGMAHLYRLIAALLFALVSVSSHALIPSQSGWSVSNPIGGGTPATFIASTKAAVCALWAPAAAQNYGTALVTSGVDSGGALCYVEVKNRTAGGANVALYGGLVAVANVCPANSTAVSGGCQCDSPYVENAAHTACDAPPDPCKALQGQSAGVWWKDTGDDNGLPMKVGFSVCDKYQSAGGGLCVATAPSRTTLCAQTEGGWWRCSGEAFYTGSTAATPSKCSESGPGGAGDDANNPMPSTPPVGLPPKAPDQPKPGTAAPAPCPAGQAPGTFNGTSMCKPIGTDRPKVADAPGNGEKETNNSDGSSTTSTTSGTTKCAEGKCTTTTNVTNVTTNAPGNSTCPSGQTAGTKTVNGQTRTTCTGTTSGTNSEAQSGFCEKNSKDKQCDGEGADTSFGGTCAGGFKAVSDDAVINAMAEETFRQNCKVNPDDASQVLGRSEAAKTGSQTGDNPNNSAVSIGAGSFDNSNALGGVASCIADKSIVVMGKSVNIAFSMICQYLEALGLVMVGVSSLLAARIVTRG